MVSGDLRTQHRVRVQFRRFRSRSLLIRQSVGRRRPVGQPGHRITSKLPGHRRGRPADHDPDPAQRVSLSTHHRDLLTLGESQAPALQIPPPARPDTPGLGQYPPPGPPARIDRHNGISDEITGLHPGPKQLQKIQSYVNRIPRHNNTHPLSVAITARTQGPSYGQGIRSRSLVLALQLANVLRPFRAIATSALPL